MSAQEKIFFAICIIFWTAYSVYQTTLAEHYRNDFLRAERMVVSLLEEERKCSLPK